MSRRGVALVVLALLGLAFAAALTLSVGRITGQHIGLASAPPSVIQGLAPTSPARAGRPSPRPRHRVGQRPKAVNRRKEPTGTAASPTATSRPPTSGAAAAAGPLTQVPAPVAPASTVTLTHAGNPVTTSAPSTRGGSSGGGDGRDRSGGSGDGGSGGSGGSGHSASGPDD